MVGVHTRSVQDDLCPEHVGQRGDLDQVEPGEQTIGSLDLMGAGNCVTTSDQRLRARPTPTEPQARRQGEGKGVGLTLPSSSAPPDRGRDARDTSDVTGSGVPDLVDRRPAGDPHTKRSPSDLPEPDFTTGPTSLTIGQGGPVTVDQDIVLHCRHADIRGAHELHSPGRRADVAAPPD